MQAPIQFADHQARRGLTPPWSNGRRGKEYHAVMDGRPVGGIFSVGVEEPHRWKDSVQSEAEIRLWVASGTAQGMRPWFAKFAGVLRDRRWLPVVERIYDWHHRHERYLRNTRSLARVALLFSEQSAAASTRRGPSGRSPITSPACTTRWSRRACRSTSCTRRSSRPRRSIATRSSCWPTPRRCRTPSARRCAPTSRAAAACSRRSRARATTSPGARRPDFGLGDVFGVRDTGGVEGPMKNSYLTLEGEAGSRHEVLRGLDDAPRVINGVWRVRVAAADGAARGRRR